MNESFELKLRFPYPSPYHLVAKGLLIIGAGVLFGSVIASGGAESAAGEAVTTLEACQAQLTEIREAFGDSRESTLVMIMGFGVMAAVYDGLGAVLAALLRGIFGRRAPHPRSES